jgi:hypothetical protein
MMGRDDVVRQHDNAIERHSDLQAEELGVGPASQRITEAGGTGGITDAC